MNVESCLNYPQSKIAIGYWEPLEPMLTLNNPAKTWLRRKRRQISQGEHSKFA